MLVLPGHTEVREEQDEDEDVVDRQRLLDQVPGEILESRLRSHDVRDARAEQKRQRDPGRAPHRRFADRDLVRLPVKDTEVQREHDEHERVEADPGPDADHRLSLSQRGGRYAAASVSSQLKVQMRERRDLRATGCSSGVSEGLAWSLT